MSRIVYRELLGENDINQCFELQKNIFELDDTNALPQMFIGFLGRDYPKTGLAIGAFSRKKLIGFILAIANFEPNSIYVMAVGVDKNFRGQNTGFHLYLELQKNAKSKNVKNCYFIYDPLESKLAHLYCNKLAVSGIKYEWDKDSTLISNDKLLAFWEFDKPLITNNPFQYNDNIIACNKYKPYFAKVLIEIPGNFIDLKKENHDKSADWRLNTRKLFAHYLNEKKYIATGFHKEKSVSITRYFYILEKDF